MTKISVEERIRAVKRYVGGNESVNAIAKSIGITKGVFQEWINLYQHHGESSLARSYTTYSLEDKLKVIQYMNDKGTSIRETVAIFNISSHSTLHRWINQFEAEGEDALKPKKKGRQPVTKEKKPTATESTTETLQAEVERLRMENAYLKKLNALVQNKEKSPNKTKYK